MADLPFKNFLVNESEVIEALIDALCTSTTVIGEMVWYARWNT